MRFWYSWHNVIISTNKTYLSEWVWLLNVGSYPFASLRAVCDQTCCTDTHEDSQNCCCSKLHLRFMGGKCVYLIPESSLLIYTTQQRLNTLLMLCDRNLEAKAAYVVWWSMFGTSENMYTACVTGFMVHRCRWELNSIYNVYFQLETPISIRICYMILETKHVYRRSMKSFINHIIQESIKFTFWSWNKWSLLNIEHWTLNKTLYYYVLIFVPLDMSSLRCKLNHH
jgi:hypothetical protein